MFQYCSAEYVQYQVVHFRMQIPIFLKDFISMFLYLKVLPLLNKYSNFVSMLYTSQGYYSKVQACIIDNT